MTLAPGRAGSKVRRESTVRRGDPLHPIVTASRAARAAERAYHGAPAPARALARLRPRICPFELILPLVPAGSAVLDIGCGSGLLLALLALDGRLGRGVGIDADRRAVAAAQRMRAALPPALRASVSIEHGDAAAAWPSGPFDVVALVDVLHHVPPDAQRALVARACAAVEPGGLVLIKDMAPRPRWCALANQAHDLLLARQWIHHRAMAEIEAWARDAGCVVERRGRAARWWYQHDWLLLRRGASGRSP